MAALKQLALGVARRDITPRHPVPLAGYAARAGLGPAASVARGLAVRVLSFAPEPGAPPRAVFAAADLLWWGPELTELLRAEIAARHGVPADGVILHASHTHSAPATSGWYSKYLGEPDPRYLDELVATTLAAVDESLSTMEPVVATLGAADVPIGTDRRAARDGSPPSPIDPTATVVRFADRGGTTKAVLVHYACHPVVHHGNAVTPDFVGAATGLLERELPPGAVAVYAQGCCGDVNPDRYAGGHYHEGGDADVAAAGGVLAGAVTAVLDGQMTPLVAPSLAVHRHRAALPVAPLPDRAELLRRRDLPGIEGEWASRMLTEPNRLRRQVTLELTALRLYGDLTLLAMSAEPTSAYGRYVKDRYAGRVLALGYTGAVFGYLVTAQQLAEGGYEAAEAPLYFAMPAPLDPSAEDAARTGIAAALAGLPA